MLFNRKFTELCIKNSLTRLRRYHPSGKTQSDTPTGATVETLKTATAKVSNVGTNILTTVTKKYSELTLSQTKCLKMYVRFATCSWLMKLYDDGKEALLKARDGPAHKRLHHCTEWEVARVVCNRRPFVNLVTSLLNPLYCVTYFMPKLVMGFSS